ncbi:MAG: [FeFe] hydrogenase H-cluster radical SAM maturase HydE [Thermotogae bacterium]|nr:MAG: [FeFe] hydrogenase H-cluster radical SAM maturase HydE [Thermotogota bacterium]
MSKKDIFQKILKKPASVSVEEVARVLEDDSLNEPLFEIANEVRNLYLGKDVYLRGIIEFSNYCRNDCLYCGIRSSNSKVSRYRMSVDEILNTAKFIAENGCGTVVLQSGEDPFYNDEMIAEIVHRIKKLDVAVTLSIGERSFKEYKTWREAGADRYLMRHETADEELYKQVHPADDFNIRKRHLEMLKQLDYEVGTGCIVGLPHQDDLSLAKDILFTYEFDSDMVGIGPFIPHPDTPLGKEKPGSLMKTLKVIALTRLFLPDSNIPATTALGTIDPRGRQLALNCGANVIMPNFTPVSYRPRFTLYPNKVCIFESDAQCGDFRDSIRDLIETAGYKAVESQGFRRRVHENNSRRI